MAEEQTYKRYPGIELSEAVESVRTLVNKLGSSGAHTAENLAAALGVSPTGGATRRKIGALTSYGLLSRSSHGYLVTPLAKQINRPMPGEMPELLKKAYLSADLFAKVYAEYEEEGRLPEALEIVLERKFGVNGNTAPYVDKMLRKSGEQAGLYDSSGNFLSESTVEVGGTGQTVSDELFENGGNSPVNVAPVPMELGMMTLELPSPRTTILVKRELTDSELKKLWKWLETIVKPQLEFHKIEANDSETSES